MKRKAHGAQESRHIQRYVEVTSTAQRSDSPAQAINQRFLRSCSEVNLTRFRRIFAGGQGSGAAAYLAVREVTLTQPSGKKDKEDVKFIS